jgi:hypothetical protein
MLSTYHLNCCLPDGRTYGVSWGFAGVVEAGGEVESFDLGSAAVCPKTQTAIANSNSPDKINDLIKYSSRVR